MRRTKVIETTCWFKQYHPERRVTLYHHLPKRHWLKRIKNLSASIHSEPDTLSFFLFFFTWPPFHFDFSFFFFLATSISFLYKYATVHNRFKCCVMHLRIRQLTVINHFEFGKLFFFFFFSNVKNILKIKQMVLGFSHFCSNKLEKGYTMWLTRSS